MDFIAIDFETANHSPSSACQLAAVVVEGGEIVAEHCWLIRPPRSYFAPKNIEIHGIRRQDVVDAPSMGKLWPEFRDIMQDKVLIAHNARFDIGVLVASLEAYNVPCPDLAFNCTRLLAKRAWPGKARYGLKPLGDWLGIRFKHHDALEDSRCCAQIALEVSRSAEATTLEELESKLRIHRGHYRRNKVKSPRFHGGGGSRGSSGLADRYGFPSKASASASRIDPETVLVASARQLPLAGKNIVMLGPLGGMTAEETSQLVVRLGGNLQASITCDTTYVVACGTTIEDASRHVAAALSQASADGAAQVRILSPRQFRALLPAGKSTTSW
ncbi:MAG: exonuclease domain-containing protein [Aureliella sp.]